MTQRCKLTQALLNEASRLQLQDINQDILTNQLALEERNEVILNLLRASVESRSKKRAALELFASLVQLGDLELVSSIVIPEQC
jgi:hypothetical protein